MILTSESGNRSMKKTVFVTVGTTSFNALIRAVDSQEVKEELFRKGYTDLLIQMGRGSYIPSKSSGENGTLAVDYYTFSSSIADCLRSASLVISHAVVNEALMDNHQRELAEELAERKHLLYCRPQTLYQTITTMDLGYLVTYQPGNATPVAKIINKFLGFPDDL